MTNEVKKFFVVFEGLDLAGKTTIVNTLADLKKGISIKSPAIPFSDITQSVLERTTPMASFCFFLASNLQTSSQALNLLNSENVFCDRYIFSTIAYHAARQQVPFSKMMELAKPFLDIIAMPNFVIFLSLERKAQLARYKERKPEKEFQQRLMFSETFQRNLLESFMGIIKLTKVPYLEINTSARSISETIEEICVFCSL